MEIKRSLKVALNDGQSKQVLNKFRMNVSI